MILKESDELISKYANDVKWIGQYKITKENS